MRDFTETKFFGAACVGLATLGTSYLAGMDSGFLITLPLLGMFAYYLCFSRERPRLILAE